MPEIEEKKRWRGTSFVPAMIMGAVFGYLVIGAMVTVITSIVLVQKRKK
jgi:hypothetical protein